MSSPGIDFGDLDIDFIESDMHVDEEAAKAASDVYDEPNAVLLEKPPRSRKAIDYEKRARKSLGKITRMLLAHPDTVADGAAMLYQAPKVATAWGDLAADNERVAKAVEMLEAGTDSPVLAMVAAVAPLAMQLVRNHEPVLEPKPRKIKVGKYEFKIPLPKVGVKLGVLRPLTNDPDKMVRSAFTDEKIIAALRDNGIVVAAPRNWHAT